MSDGNSSVIVCSVRRERPTARLICFPHGGGAAHAFRSWPDSLPDWLEVLSVNPPGRGARLREPLVNEMGALVEALLPALLPRLDLPFVFFGHSVGALVAFETARRLEALGVPPLHVVVSGHAEPSAGDAAARASEACDEELIAGIVELGLLPAGTLEPPELRDLVLQPLRADFRLAESYSIGAGVRLACPLTAIGGDADPTLPTDKLAAWSDRTSVQFSSRTFEGGHFYTETAREDLLAFIADLVAVSLDRLPPSVMLGAHEEYPLGTCLHELFRAQARATPDTVALVDMDRQLTFAELDAESDALSPALVERGCGVDRMAAILMETSADYVVAMLGILKAGGAYLPIPVHTPDKAIADILDTVRPMVVITRPALRSRLPAVWHDPQRCITLDRGHLDVSPEPGKVLSGACSGDPTPLSLAYCVMTSGTTGKPKGIVCPHQGAVNSYWWRFVHLPYGNHEREACNVFFIWEVLRPLLRGRPAYIIPDDVIFDPRRLVDFLARNEITRVLFTPSLLEQVLNAVGDGIAARLPALRIMILNGEVVSLKLAERFRAVLPHVALVNDYSISECHDVSTGLIGDNRPSPASRTFPAGRVMANVRVYVLDDAMQPVPWGVPGEVYVAGPTLARGYLGLPEETAARFLPDPIAGGDERMFRTGDIGRTLPDGRLEIRGRSKFMVKLRGYTVVPSAVEAEIAAFHAVGAVAVVPVDDPETGQPESLAAYVAGREGLLHDGEIAELRAHLKERLQAYAIPAHIVPVIALPIQATTGKVDRKQLPAPPRNAHEVGETCDAAGIEPGMRTLWRDVLGRAPSGAGDNFFDLGGHSLLAIRLALETEKRFGVSLDVVDVFNHPSLGAFCSHVASRMPTAPSGGGENAGTSVDRAVRANGSADIAVTAIACRLPGAATPDALWKNLTEGVVSVRRFTPVELTARGVPGRLVERADYVAAGAIVDGVDQFDARYFGLSDREATLMDPQQRLFLECCAEALSDAGLSLKAREGVARRIDIGVWAGCYLPSYLVHHLGADVHLDAGDPTTFHLAEIGNDKDYLATRAAYLLDLTGPAVSVQTSCSTGLVAIAEAAAALAAGRCDAAIAGASSITFPQGGYLCVDGHIGSRSGHCRSFDCDADGTILGDGVGVVVLRRLEDALADGSRVLAVIKGFAVNNDGAGKAGYSAPSGIGQARAIRAAMDMAGVDGGGIGYVEGHGTATVIGDPIEVRALADAFGAPGRATRDCVLGSIKANIGHSNIAAGVAGFIKAVLMLQHRYIPPQINYDRPNPQLRLEETPFRIETTGRPWDVAAGQKRRAGISSFGIGGTNAHVVIEEAPSGCQGATPPMAERPRFDRRRYWPASDVALTRAVSAGSSPRQRPSANEADRKLPWQDRFYVPSMRRASAPVALAQGAPSQNWLILSPPHDVDWATEGLAAGIEARGHRVSICRTLDPRELGSAIERHCLGECGPGHQPARMITTWHLARQRERPTAEALIAPVILLARLLNDRPERKPLSLFVLAQDVVAVGEMPTTSPWNAVLPGPLISLQQEDPSIEARVIDAGPVRSTLDRFLTPIVDECTVADPRPERLVAIRSGVRWVERFDRLGLSEAQRIPGRERLRHGPHIVIGGTGRIGRVLAAHLAGLGADVVLVSRHAGGGAIPHDRIHHVATDITSADGVALILVEIARRYGRIGGIFHAAGLARLLDLAEVTPDSLTVELAPKIAGTDALAAAIRRLEGRSHPGSELRPDFVMLFSSLAATLGGLGLGAYAAANRYLDAFAVAPENQDLPLISVGWDDWDFDYGDQQQASYAHTRRRLAIAPQEGLAAIEAILGEPSLPRVLVSATTLEPRLERWVYRATATLRIDQSPSGGRLAGDARPTPETSAPQDAGRPNGEGASGGADDDETRVGDAYRSVLGAHTIGIDDDFFELGGDSLLATEIVLAIGRGGDGGGIRIADVLDHPSIRKLSRHLAQKRHEMNRPGRLQHEADDV